MGCCRAFDTFHVFQLVRPYYIDDNNNVYIFQNGWLRRLPISHDGYVTLEMTQGARIGWEDIDRDPHVRFRRNSNLIDVNVIVLSHWVDILEEEGWADHLDDTYDDFPDRLARIMIDNYDRRVYYNQNNKEFLG